MKQFSNIPALLYDQDRLNELFKLFVYGMGVLLVNLILFVAVRVSVTHHVYCTPDSKQETPPDRDSWSLSLSLSWCGSLLLSRSADARY